jgi:hypothetical protein
MMTRALITFKWSYSVTEINIILAVIGMIGLFATATIYQRANRIASKYYGANKVNHDLIALNSREFN